MIAMIKSVAAIGGTLPVQATLDVYKKCGWPIFPALIEFLDGENGRQYSSLLNMPRLRYSWLRSGQRLLSCGVAASHIRFSRSHAGPKIPLLGSCAFSGERALARFSREILGGDWSFAAVGWNQYKILGIPAGAVTECIILIGDNSRYLMYLPDFYSARSFDDWASVLSFVLEDQLLAEPSINFDNEQHSLKLVEYHVTEEFRW